MSSLTGSPSGSAEKGPSSMQDMQVQSRGQEDPLEDEIATHFSIFVW